MEPIENQRINQILDAYPLLSDKEQKQLREEETAVADLWAKVEQRQQRQEKRLKMNPKPLIQTASKVSLAQEFQKLSADELAQEIVQADLRFLRKLQRLPDIETSLEDSLKTHCALLSRYVTATILLAPKNQSKAIVEKWCKVLQKLREYPIEKGRKGDDLGCIAIGGALRGASISRLSATKNLSKKATKELEEYDKLAETYGKVSEATKRLSECALTHPAFLKSAIAGARENENTEDKIKALATIAEAYRIATKAIPTKEKRPTTFHLNIPPLPPPGFTLPKSFDSGEPVEDYLYYLSRQLQPGMA